MNAGDDPLRAARLGKLESLRARGIEPYPRSFARSAEAAALDERYAGLAAGAESGDRVRVAGRVLASRNSGMFIDLHDASGKIQVFNHKDYLDPDGMAVLRLLDIGDVIGAEGRIRRTPRGELTINAEALTILAKSLRPLPEKYHGLADIELRYRQRYVDLIVNAGSRETLRRRSRLIAALRRHLWDRGYVEVETPMLHMIQGGASAKPFITHHNALDIDLYLRVAPELHLKRLIVGGLADRLFEINRCFRNEGLSPRHNPEFTSLELYEAYVDYAAMMTLTEELVVCAAEEVTGGVKIEYGGTTIDLTPPWPRRSMADLVREATGVDFLALDAAAARESATGCTKRPGGGMPSKRRSRRGSKTGCCSRPTSPGFRATSRRSPKPIRAIRAWSNVSRPISTAGKSPTRLPSSTTRPTSGLGSPPRWRPAPRVTKRPSRSTKTT
jgi:lysyl-tRNA synthetase, class II